MQIEHIVIQSNAAAIYYGPARALTSNRQCRIDVEIPSGRSVLEGTGDREDVLTGRQADCVRSAERVAFLNGCPQGAGAAVWRRFANAIPWTRIGRVDCCIYGEGCGEPGVAIQHCAREGDANVGAPLQAT